MTPMDEQTFVVVFLFWVSFIAVIVFVVVQEVYRHYHVEGVPSDASISAEPEEGEPFSDSDFSD
jgi:hypothetical protein